MGFKCYQIWAVVILVGVVFLTWILRILDEREKEIDSERND